MLYHGRALPFRSTGPCLCDNLFPLKRTRAPLNRFILHSRWRDELSRYISREMKGRHGGVAGNKCLIEIYAKLPRATASMTHSFTSISLIYAMALKRSRARARLSKTRIEALDSHF